MPIKYVQPLQITDNILCIFNNRLFDIQKHFAKFYRTWKNDLSGPKTKKQKKCPPLI
jgi:hypothetical protein